MKFVLAVCTVALVVCLTLGQSNSRCACQKCSRKLELGIVLDSSSSISEDDFKKGLSFLQEYLSKFNIGQGSTRVSIITFGRTVYPEDAFGLTTYDSTRKVVQAIGDIPHRAADYTNTGAGIKFMRERQLGSQYVRRNVPKVAVVLTDGMSQDRNATAGEARRARQQGIVMFAIGVGPNVDYQELLNIAGHDDRVDTVGSYSKLVTIIDWLAKVTCVTDNKPRPRVTG